MVKLYGQDKEARVRSAVAECVQEVAVRQGTDVFEAIGADVVATIRKSFVSRQMCCPHRSTLAAPYEGHNEDAQ